MTTVNINLAAGVRHEGDSQIATTTASAMASFLKSDGARLVSDNEGRLHFHLTNSKDRSYFSIGCGKTVSLTAKGDARIAELLNNYVIYTGTADRAGNQLEKPWFSFGKVPTNSEPVAVVTGAQLAEMLKGAMNLVKGN